jgi:hypothetical protein
MLRPPAPDQLLVVVGLGVVDLVRELGGFVPPVLLADLWVLSPAQFVATGHGVDVQRLVRDRPSHLPLMPIKWAARASSAMRDLGARQSLIVASTACTGSLVIRHMP